MASIETWFRGYLILINFFLFFLMGLDKYQAKYRHWRIPEKILLTMGFLGGGLGGLGGQKAFHHKTRKPVFYLVFMTGIIIAVALWFFVK